MKKKLAVAVVTCMMTVLMAGCGKKEDNTLNHEGRIKQ